MHRPKVPINAELIEACSALTLYEKDLLVQRFANQKPLDAIAKHLGKTKGTVSPHIAKALNTYERWYKSTRKETRIRKLEVAEPDPELKALQKELDSELKVVALYEAKEKARKQLKEAKLRKLRYESINSSKKLNEYVLKYVIGRMGNLVGEIRKYLPNKTIAQAMTDAFGGLKLDPGLADDEELTFSFCKGQIEGWIRPLKREYLRQEARRGVAYLTCSKIDPHEKEKCGMVVEYDPKEPSQFYCPWHEPLGSIFRYPGIRYICVVCREMGDKDANGKTPIVQYIPQRNTLQCKHCGSETPVHPIGLEERGSADLRRKLAWIEESRKGSNIFAGMGYAKSVYWRRLNDGNKS